MIRSDNRLYGEIGKAQRVPLKSKRGDARIDGRERRWSAVESLEIVSVHRKVERLIQRRGAVGRTGIGVAWTKAVAEGPGRGGFDAARRTGPLRLIERRPGNVIGSEIRAGELNLVSGLRRVQHVEARRADDLRLVVQRARQSVFLSQRYDRVQTVRNALAVV